MLSRAHIKDVLIASNLVQTATHERSQIDCISKSLIEVMRHGQLRYPSAAQFPRLGQLVR